MQFPEVWAGMRTLQELLLQVTRASKGGVERTGEASGAGGAGCIGDTSQPLACNDVVEALKRAEFTDVEIFADAYGGRPWIVRFAMNGATGTLAMVIEAEAHASRLERVQKRARYVGHDESLWPPFS